MLIMILYISINFILVLYFLVIIVGLGCGGKKLCVISKSESIGIYINIGDIFVLWVIVNKIGIRRIKLILKKSVILIINVE